MASDFIITQQQRIYSMLNLIESSFKLSEESKRGNFLQTFSFCQKNFWQLHVYQVRND